jgi:hypothetical protein
MRIDDRVSFNFDSEVERERRSITRDNHRRSLFVRVDWSHSNDSIVVVKRSVTTSEQPFDTMSRTNRTDDIDTATIDECAFRWSLKIRRFIVSIEVPSFVNGTPINRASERRRYISMCTNTVIDGTRTDQCTCEHRTVFSSIVKE